MTDLGAIYPWCYWLNDTNYIKWHILSGLHPGLEWTSKQLQCVISQNERLTCLHGYVQDDGKGADTHLSESSPEGLDRGKSRGHSNPGGHTALQTPSVAAQVPLEVRQATEHGSSWKGFELEPLNAVMGCSELFRCPTHLDFEGNLGYGVGHWWNDYGPRMRSIW